jgi:hypothetical protein
VTLGRVLAIVFDEYKLFGQAALERFDMQYWMSPQVNNHHLHSAVSLAATKATPKGRHVRQTFELGHGQSRPMQHPGVSDFASKAGDLATLPVDNHLDATKNADTDIQDLSEQAKADKADLKHEFKVDSKMDFQNLMRLSVISDNVTDINLKPLSSPGKEFGVDRPLKSMMPAYGGITGVGTRRYMTMPAPLSTILETSDDMPSYSERNDSRIGTRMDAAGDVIASDHIVRPVYASNTKQMRRPKVVKGLGVELESSTKQKDQSKSMRSVDRIITSDDILTSMGDAYLDNLPTLEGLASTSR